MFREKDFAHKNTPAGKFPAGVFLCCGSLLVLPGKVFGVEGAGGVEDGQHHDADVGEDGGPHACQTQSAEDQAGELDGQREDDVLVDDAEGAAGDAHGQRDLGRVVVHQDDVRGLNGGVRAQRTHGDAEVGAGQDGRVVDAVAHEGEVLFRAFGGEERFDLVHLVAGQQTGMVFVQTQLIGDRSGYRLGVAGQHHGLADACGLQAPDGLRAVGLDHVRDEQITGVLPLDGHMHEGARLGHFGGGEAQFCHQAGVTGGNGFAVHLCCHAVAAKFLDIGDAAGVDVPAVSGLDAQGDGVFGPALGQGGGLHEGVFGDTVFGVDAHDLEGALGQGAGLIKDHDPGAGQLFQIGGAFDEDAAGAGTANPLMTLAILFINGICLGAGILVSTAFGAGDTELVERQVSTTAIAGTVFSLAFSLLCILLANPLLRLLQVPAEILPIAVNYLRIVFAGLLFTFFYNFLAATLRALGDSKSALYFLMISAVLNIGGDLFFVQALGWGSEGCALSTVLSEGMCCLLCALYIRWKVPVLQLGRRWFVFDGKLLRKTVSYGWVSAMQQATVQLGKIAVQAIVNTMGVSAMAAFTAASRIDDFAYTPQQNIAHAMTTFMAQNEGAGKKDRVKDGYRCGMRIEVVYALGLMAVCLIFAEPIIRLFVTDPEVVDLGVRFLRTISLFYLMPAATNGIQGFFRGIGDLRITLISSILNMAGRVAAASVLVLLWKMEIEALPYSYAFGWVLMLAYELPAMLRYLRKNKM